MAGLTSRQSFSRLRLIILRNGSRTVFATNEAEVITETVKEFNVGLALKDQAQRKACHRGTLAESRRSEVMSPPPEVQQPAVDFKRLGKAGWLLMR